MPARNSVKQHVEDSYYHLYNRGVEKRQIFQDSQDHAVFLNYLKEYLLPKDEKVLRDKLSEPNLSSKERNKIVKLLRLNNFSQEITLLAYCLMPNHFHLFIKQKSAYSIDKFMNSLCTRYTMYFNRKYKRVGPLFQGVYKAVLVKSEEQFLYLSSYIHKQALQSPESPCSYLEYLGERKTTWIQPKEVLAYFSKTNPRFSYKEFVKQTEDFTPINNLIIEE
jgi:REP element-mobilizing transposase RayT